MCHIILLMPVIGLVVFWIWPLSIAIPVYLVILVISITLYIAIMRAMSRPAVTGSEGLVGKSVEVIDMSGLKGHVRVENEIWDARADEPLQNGDEAHVIAVQGMTLKIAGSHVIDSLK